MKKIIVVFRSKTEVFGYMDALSERGIPADITGTPKEAGIGCGIAVEVDYGFAARARDIAREKGFRGFYGIFVEERSGARRSLRRLA